MSRTLRAVAAALALALIPACGDDGDNVVVNQTIQFTPASGTLVGLAATGDVLIFVDPADPGVTIRSVPLLFGSAAVTLESIAIRPADGQLYGWGDDQHTYHVDMVTGSVVRFGNNAAIFGAAEFDVSVDPVADRLRVVLSTLDSMRVDLATSVSFVDTDLASQVFAIAYSNNVAGAGSTTLFAVDGTNLVTIGGPGGVPSPDGGTVAIVGPHGAPAGTPSGLAISPSGTAYMTHRNVALFTQLFVVNLNTGAATLAGPFGSGFQLKGLAVVP